MSALSYSIDKRRSRATKAEMEARRSALIGIVAEQQPIPGLKKSWGPPPRPVPFARPPDGAPGLIEIGNEIIKLSYVREFT
jgi:hypothetical protein